MGIKVNRNYKFTKHVRKVISSTNNNLSHVTKLRNQIPDTQLAMEVLSLGVLVGRAKLAARDLPNMRRLQRLRPDQKSNADVCLTHAEKDKAVEHEKSVQDPTYVIDYENNFG